MMLSTLLCFVCFMLSLSFYVFVKMHIASRNINGQGIKDSGKKTVLVTGGAGFVGMHLASALIRKGHKVVVIDNFNDYYDVKLKIDRAYHIKKMGVEVYAEDVCRTEFLEELFQNYQFTHVAHLAAQAGVRYSLDNPLAYIHANVECQLALLDVLKDYKHIKLVYASSSSVYGKEADVPFRLTARTDRPGNMYAATKKTDEHLGLHYCENYGIVSVGLRFFTVYGPWGRPDMSIFKFGDAIMSGTKLPMFFVSDDEPLGRDFTYVEDVISGVIASLDYIPGTCGERFNLGFGNPVSVPDMIRIMETKIGMKADIEKLPMPPTEILRTWADISASTALLGFKPKTNLTIGVANFVSWFKPYRQKREVEDEANEPSESEVWFAKLYDDQLKRHAKYSKNLELHNKERTVRRVTHEKHKYYENTPTNKQYSKHKGVSPGHDLVHYVEHKGKIELLKQLCEEMPLCHGFTSNGKLKTHILPLSKWKNTESNEIHTYVAEIKDWCSSEAHQCCVYGECSNHEQDFYKCMCSEGYTGDGHSCLAKYGRLGKDKMRLDYLHLYNNVFNLTEMKNEKEMIFFKGLESVGGDYLSAPQFAGNTNKLFEICAAETLCIAFTTDGRLKLQVSPHSEWLDYTSSDGGGGMYVFDMNYCMFSGKKCPENSECKHLGAGKSECVCSADFVMYFNECYKVPVSRTLIPALAHCTGNRC